MPFALHRDSPVLITGGAGFIGKSLARNLVSDARNVVVADWKAKQVDTPGVSTFRIDVRDGDAMLQLIKDRRPGVIFHLAAQSYPEVSKSKPLETLDINVNGTACLFESIVAMRELDIAYQPVVIVAGSAAMYGDSCARAKGPVPETADILPLNPYGVSKAAQDLLAFQYWRRCGVQAVRARIFNTSGPGKVGDVSSDLARRVAEIARSGGQLKVGNLSSRRAYLDVDDLVDALISLAANGEPGEAYNISAETVRSVSDLIGIFEEHASMTLLPAVDPHLVRTADEPVIVGDTTKLRQATGWRPKRDFKQTLGAMLQLELHRPPQSPGQND